MKRSIIVIMVLSLVLTSIPVKGEETNNTFTTVTTEYSKLRASSLISCSVWIFGSSKCNFSLTFHERSTGSGTATLQKKVNGVWSDYSYTSRFSFENMWDIAGNLTVNSLPSGTYRMKYYVSIGSRSETLYSDEEYL